MEVARITTKGQITIPIEIRKKLNVKEGDKILFLNELKTLLCQEHSIVLCSYVN